MTIEHDYSDIKAVHQTLRHDVTNAYLALGWRFLKILVKDDKGQYSGFVLSWPSTDQPPRPKYDAQVRRFFIGDTEPRRYFTEDERSA